MFDAKGRRHLVVPLIYIWFGAIQIDVPVSGSVCIDYPSLAPIYSARKMFSGACRIASIPTETETRQALKIFTLIKVIVRVNQAPVHNLSLFNK